MSHRKKDGGEGREEGKEFAALYPYVEYGVLNMGVEGSTVQSFGY